MKNKTATLAPGTTNGKAGRLSPSEPIKSAHIQSWWLVGPNPEAFRTAFSKELPRIVQNRVSKHLTLPTWIQD